MVLLLAVAVVSHAAPLIEVAEPITGASLKLPPGPLCVTVPSVEFNAEACAPRTAAQLENERPMLQRLGIVGFARAPRGIGIMVKARQVAPRKGKISSSILRQLFDDLAKGVTDDGKPATFARHGDEVYEIETYNGVTAARAEMPMPSAQKTSVTWVVLAPNVDLLVTVAGAGSVDELRKLGAAMLGALQMPERQRVDLTGRVAIP
jgi:hypothetical protein